MTRSRLDAFEADPCSRAEAAYIRGTATLAQYARLAQPWIRSLRGRLLPRLLAAEARERAGLLPRWPNDWQTVTVERLAAYPPGFPVPQELTRTLEQAVTVALTVPAQPGLLPAAARYRSDCAFTLLLLGDEAGDLLRQRVWRRRAEAWSWAEDLTAAAGRHGLPALEAEDFMGVPGGYFRNQPPEGEANPVSEAETPDVPAAIDWVSYLDMAKCVRPPETVSDGQIWSLADALSCEGGLDQATTSSR